MNVKITRRHTPEVKPHPNGTYLVDLRQRLTEGRPKRAVAWAALLEEVTHCGDPRCPMCSVARQYVVGHSPYQSTRTLRIAALTVRRRAARREMRHLVDPNPFCLCGVERWEGYTTELADVLRLAARYRLASAVGLENELPGRACLFRAEERRLAYAHWVLLSRQADLMPPLGHPHRPDGVCMGWTADKLETLECCRAVKGGHPQNIRHHCKTQKHVAGLFGVPVLKLRAVRNAYRDAFGIVRPGHIENLRAELDL